MLAQYLLHPCVRLSDIGRYCIETAEYIELILALIRCVITKFGHLGK